MIINRIDNKQHYATPLVYNISGKTSAIYVNDVIFELSQVVLLLRMQADDIIFDFMFKLLD